MASDLEFALLQAADPLLVHKPPHYSLPGHDIECTDIAIILKMDLLVGSAFQYLWRAGRQDGLAKGDDAKHLVDLKKARWYIDRRIKQLEAAQSPETKIVPLCMSKSLPGPGIEAEPCTFVNGHGGPHSWHVLSKV